MKNQLYTPIFKTRNTIEAFRYGIDEAPKWFIRLLTNGQVYQCYDFGIIYLRGFLKRIEIGDVICQKCYNDEIFITTQEEFQKSYIPTECHTSA